MDLMDFLNICSEVKQKCRRPNITAPHVSIAMVGTFFTSHNSLHRWLSYKYYAPFCYC